MQGEPAYVQALSEHFGDKILPAVVELLSLHVCPRCCLRFTGIRHKIYAEPSPASAHFEASVQAALNTSLTNSTPGGQAAATAPAQTKSADQPVTAGTEQAACLEPHTTTDKTSSLDTTSAPAAAPTACTPLAEAAQRQAPAVHSVASLQAASTDPPTEVIAASSANENSAVSNTVSAPSDDGAAAVAVAVADAVCPACLGVLQTPEQAVQAVPAAMLAGLPEAEGNAGSWQTCTSGSCDTLAQCIRQEGHTPATIGLDITLPAASITRQLALWHHLRNKFASQGLYSSPHMHQEVVDLKEALRWMVAAPLAQQLGVGCDREGDLRIMLSYLHPASSSETDFLFINGGGGKGRGYKRKRGQPKVMYAGRPASETVVQQAARLSQRYFLQHCAWPLPRVTGGVQLAYRVWRRPLYVAGRYLKLLRGVAQSPWIIDGQRKGESSVEERIADAVLPQFKADRHKFMTAGREDFDVRMLGSGRPFVLEVINARAAVPPQSVFEAMQAALQQEDHGVQVQVLQSVPRSICSLLKAGESEKQKSYTAVCQLPTAVTPEMLDIIHSTKDLELHQQTPVRVSHRRADLVRLRTVYAMKCEPVPGSPHHIVLQLRTQAGTYIKEFVHSDDGRTQPHLATILGLSKPASILQLDVNQIHMNFLNGESTAPKCKSTD